MLIVVWVNLGNTVVSRSLGEHMAVTLVIDSEYYFYVMKNGIRVHFYFSFKIILNRSTKLFSTEVLKYSCDYW